MFSTALKKTSVGNVGRRFRMVLDFKVDVTEITEDDIHEYFMFHRIDEEADESALVWEKAKRQNRLLQTLIKDQEVLDKFLTFILTEEVEPNKEGELKRIFQVENEKEILSEVISKLSKKDAAYFRELLDEGQFWENAELFGDSFVIQWVGASLMETRVIREGLPE
jgi:hypothetical protein